MRENWIAEREHGIPFFEEFELPYLYEHWPEDALPHRQPGRTYLVEADERLGPWPAQGDRLFGMPHEYPAGKPFSDDWRYPPWWPAWASTTTYHSLRRDLARGYAQEPVLGVMLPASPS